MALTPAEKQRRYRERHRVPLPRRSCVECGETFQPNRQDHVLCSARCRKAPVERPSRQRPRMSAPDPWVEDGERSRAADYRRNLVVLDQAPPVGLAARPHGLTRLGSSTGAWPARSETSG
jgi:hypothetical protein